MQFRYFGPDVRTYPGIVVDGHVLVAEPGDVRELDEAPNDGLWIQVVKPGSHKTDEKAGA